MSMVRQLLVVVMVVENKDGRAAAAGVVVDACARSLRISLVVNAPTKPLRHGRAGAKYEQNKRKSRT